MPTTAALQGREALPHLSSPDVGIMLALGVKYFSGSLPEEAVYMLKVFALDFYSGKFRQQVR